MDLNLKGKTVVVTGGSKGIGYAIAKEFLIEGANVFITGRELQALKKAQSELSQFGSLEVCPGDGTNEKDVEAAVFGIQSAVKYMKKGGGSIVNISSLAARCSTCGRSNIYGSMKAGLLSLTRNYAGEALEVCGGQNIVLNPWFSEEKNY